MTKKQRAELIRHKEEYNDLLDVREEDIGLPGYKRKMTDEQFMGRERQLLYKGLRMRAEAGIRTQGEAVLCEECREFFNPKQEDKMLKYQDCRLHKGRQVLVI